MKHIILLLVAITVSQFGFSQNRAPSCWLKYQDSFQGDILINTVKVQSPSPTYTYYCNLQWNAGMEGGGYCGIQEHPQGRNFIFSIWDPITSTDAITAPYTHNGTQIENFGGEGTGLKSWNFDIGWDTDQWYSFVTRAWDSNTHTMFGYWVFNHSDQEWYHLVTMDYPVANVRFNSSTGSFIEDWLGNGFNTREVHHKEGWKRKTSDLSWSPLTSSFFERVSPDAGAVNYINNYDGGVGADYYFMKSGGAVTPVTNTSKTTLSLSNNNTDHGFLTGEVSQLNTTINGNILILDWDVNKSKSPQFSYHVAIYDNSTFSGTPIIQFDQNVPDERTLDIDISSLISGNKYYIQFYIIDIFGNQSAFMTDSFEDLTLSIDDLDKQFSFSCYPNPFQDKIYLNFNNNKLEKYTIELTTISGSSVFSNDYHTNSEIEIYFPDNMKKGLYFLCINNQDGKSRTIKLIKE